MGFTFKENKLKYKDEVIYEFENKITNIISFEKVVVVVLDYYTAKINENVYGFNYKGELLWQIPKFQFVDEKSAYIDIHLTPNNLIKANNWDGSFVIINPINGEVLLNPIEAMKGKRLW